MKSSILVFAVFYSVVSGSQAADLSAQQLIHQQARASPGGAISPTPCGGSPVCPRTGGVIRISAGNAVFSDHPRRVGRH
ncbi:MULTISPECIES: hypothetical protein [Photorhabdus]|uniref:Uncharacterized protein n=1 Tax=Photorhabdus luminescens TaxID=29488 RepID=A0A1G5RD38_PHOLU|nr:hypothetical protein [Photorhabdus luminescens]SCZ71967.1 hypothetical protein SAMN02982990_03919 [Photorhabdus luminescens]